MNVFKSTSNNVTPKQHRLSLKKHETGGLYHAVAKSDNIVVFFSYFPNNLSLLS